MLGRARGDDTATLPVPVNRQKGVRGMYRWTRASDDLHMRAAVERLVRDGHSQREIEAIVMRMLGGQPARPSVGTRLRRLVRA
jgi:hypothetical protein